MDGVTVKNTEGTRSVPSIYSMDAIQPDAMDAIWLASLSVYYDF